MEIRLLISLSTSCLHAAAARARGAVPADPAIMQAIDEPLTQFLKMATASDVALTSLLHHLVPLSVQIDNTQLLVETALKKTVGPGMVATAASRLTDALRDLQLAFREAFPDVMEQLEIRGPVIRDQWEARGPGLLREMQELTEEGLLVSHADLVLVQPYLGGGGDPYLYYNLVVLEAVLANPHDDLPEVVRLGWMLAQLNLEAPIWSEIIRPARLPRIAALAMLPLALAAAEKVELAQCSSATVQRAIKAWRVDVDDPAAVADCVSQWWFTYLHARPRFPVALAALDQMLGDKS